MEFKHVSVLLNESIDGLNIARDGVYVDCTTGGGGHSLEIVKKLKNGHLYCFDKDEEAIEAAKVKLKKYLDKITFICGSFADIKLWLNSYHVDAVDGILADLGVSSYQIDNPQRGFSYINDGPLDMRMNIKQSLTAYEVINNYSQQQLEKILFNFGEEKHAKQIVSKIMRQREKKPIDSTTELKQIVASCYPFALQNKPAIANKVFQAIRIEVNNELDELQSSLEDMIDLLKPKGRLCIITFQTLEDRIAKNVFKIHSTDCLCPPKIPKCICGHKADLKLVTKKPIIPSEEEIKSNSRSISAKLRVVVKL